MAYMNEVSKVMDMPHVMQYITGRVADVGCGPQKITPDAVGFDGRPLEGVDVVANGCWIKKYDEFDTVFSSHYLEHTPSPFDYIIDWYKALKIGGHLVLYLPDQRWYDNDTNPEHLHSWKYNDFIFWFKRVFCGEAKDFTGKQFPPAFKLIESGEHHGNDLYSFYVVARKV